MQLLNSALARLSEDYLGGISVDRVVTVVGVLLSYVLAHAFQRIPARMAAAKHIFSIVSTIFLFGPVQEQYTGLIHMAVGSAAIYGLIRWIKSAYMPYIVFLAAMLHMSYSHIQRQIHERSTGAVVMDYTGAQMVFVIKVTSLAFCVYDGRPNVVHPHMSAYQRKNAISRVPGVLEYLGYVFFFAGFSVGPAFELATYRKMIALDDTRARRQLPRRAYRKLLEGAFWMVIYVAYSNVYTYQAMTKPQFYAHRSLLSSALYMCTTGLVVRSAYYTAWKMGEGACILAGLGFDGYDAHGAVQWMDIANVHVRGVELGSSLRQLIDSWNVGTNTWLRHHVYLRISRTPADGARASSTRATVLTFLVSAWWHGFYPGYYLTFVLIALAANAARILRRNLHAIAALPADNHASALRRCVKCVYDVAGWILSKYTLDFAAAPFMVLSLQPSMQLWRDNYFVVPLAVLGIFIAFNVLGAGRFIRSLVGQPQSAPGKKTGKRLKK
ncbi:Lysophospholipid acyltransferase [Coemansia sp. RSA 2523]|nr:Lysophospholipid acyltransferase [Coemansia sp. RSA 2523]KAJ2149748.1 Lysophospholipid acyltransferase [Coemansia sp. RSA 637]KAJ2529184.1 Lysophospholipid acyltransferase [Coemansia sp. RSA 1935]